MTEEESKSYVETIRRGMLWASGTNEKQKLAASIGCPRSRFSSFLSCKRDLSKTQLAKAEQWLRKNGFWLEILPLAPKGNNPSSILAAKLRAMADILDSPFFDYSNKIKQFGQFIKDLHSGLEAYISAIEKSGRDAG